jgi:hypothetical protein
VVQQLPLLLRIRRVPASNLSPETDYPDWGFSSFSSITPSKCRVVPEIRPRPLPSTPFLIHHSLSFDIKVTDTKNGGRVLDPSAHLLSRALVSQSVSDSWCIKYSVTSSVKKTPSYVSHSLSLSAPPAFIRVGQLLAMTLNKPQTR